MSDQEVFYTTCNGKLSGCASRPFAAHNLAASRAEEQNARAEGLGIKARYTVATGKMSDFPKKN